MTQIIFPNWTVEKTLKSYPNSLPVFILLKTNCIGCLMTRFCTLEEVADTYGIPIKTMVAELENPMKQQLLEERK
jgi:hypothetical protein